MKKERSEIDSGNDLRRLAEERLKESKSSLDSCVVEKGRDALALVHELQVHQIQLEMQNEALKLAKLETEDVLAKYSDLYDFAPMGLFAFDEQGQIQEINLAGAKLLGAERRTLMARHFQQFVAPKDRPSFGEFCKMAFEASTKQTCELNLLNDGEPTVYVRIEGIVSEDGSLNRRQCRIAAIDITERRWMEEELRKARDELERRVLERTTELSRAKEHLEVINEKLLIEITKHERLERELIKTKEVAEAAVEAKAAFLANMSHELRTPMNAVIGFSSLLLDENLTPEQRDCVESIRNGGGALLSIISDILEFSRVEKEKVKLDHQPFSLKHCIDESLDMIAVQAKQKGLDITQAVSNDAPDAIIGDHDRLRQILTNLLSNAVKFTDDGEVSVSVSSKAIAGNKFWIAFAVKDTGIGIPSDKIDRIFKPFTQLDYKISRKRGGGAGLGLAISKELVELMSGEIWVESEPDRGSTFRFTILAEAATGKLLDLKEASNDTVYKNLSEQNPLAIMVAEDSPINQRVIVKMLMKMGYRPDTVADGFEVLQVLKIRHYDLILMDINMPEMDGITATKEIRRLWPAAEQPHIVAVTAFAMESDRETCLEAGMNDYIAKPVLKKDLETILMKYSEVPV
jgi:PAS domain S-box-containing protein